MNFSQDELASAAPAESDPNCEDQPEQSESSQQAKEDLLQNFDLDDFDDEFNDDFESEVEGEYELEDDEYAEQLAEMLDMDSETFAEFVDDTDDDETKRDDEPEAEASPE